MKRALPGAKRKKATSARKPAVKRPTTRSKSKPKKIAAKKRVSVKRTKTVTTKAKVSKPKPIRAKAAKAKRPLAAKSKTAKRVIRKKAAVVDSGFALSPAVTAPQKTPAKPKTTRKSVGIPALVTQAEPNLPFAIESDEELAMPAVALTEASGTRRSATTKPPRKNGRHPTNQPEFTVPAFLLEGDEPNHPTLSGPGEKFSLGPTPPLDHFDEAKAPLPDSYGTGRLFLTARDPHWLYAHWDFTMQEQFRYNAQSIDRHMVLRLHDTEKPSRHISEIHVHPESRHWFTHVETAGKNYFTEIGYYQTGHKWKSLATSEPQRTPPDNISSDSTIEFATIPIELPFETMLAMLKEQSPAEAGQNLPLAHAIENIWARQDFPEAAPVADWTSEQEQALADVLAADRASVALPSSEEFTTEKPTPEFAFDYETGAAAPLAPPTSYVSSFFGGEGQKDFWFNVNAELIIYGATEPNATVTFAGKQILLRPDGSFRFHFSLPDGHYELPVTAVSADGTDGRAVELKFTRASEIRGHVSPHPQDPALTPPPKAENL